jgi:hypothetical protein
MKNNSLILIFVLLIIIILSLSVVSASSYNIKFNQVDGKLLVKHNIIFDSLQTISLPLPNDATSLSSAPQGAIADNNLTITGREIQVSYIAREDLEQSEKGYYFVTKIPLVFDADKVTIKLILSEGYFLSPDNAFPKPESITTDGKQIIVSWELTDIKKGTDFPVFVAIESKSQATITWIIWILAIITIAFIAYFVYDKYIKKRKAERKPKQKRREKQKEDIEKYLIESEKAVLKELKQADRGELWQKQLQIKTNFSKAKLSRVIRNLEARNLLEKIPFGNTNKIRLK